ncbi:bifunctional 3-deoxy-7-phosphoheptulonate synthase/chorismate mutase type II [Fulvivirga ulvae]|uniref:bifunctional 3-deoxy-7-phosphoheptulonate synthase/chorismate mutase type II n=1 Tax=Fulvivirga ulvae TaxID=2904245 RepID=UPI001F415F06|nr:bifunctional 3-deoxy-7-phosphoheptulonate synthase/chorismate mutase type II [Fulvivirga ulvae]UII34846.1 bifunctional 3-deoxy-7-phosphoheptulonate synthase/chorismate mutase type II [Fulvivirga ulvae]
MKKDEWIGRFQKPWIIAGPCSAESEEQLLKTVKAVAALGIEVIRAGVWKPRTRPNSFEGIGIKALEWIQRIKKECKVKFITEVASAQHVELALKYDLDMVWIGARTTVNPFTVQEIADALKGSTLPVLVKNPVNPDLALWMGAIERIANTGLTEIGAIHRGFSSFRKSKYRNEPVWQIPVELKASIPHIPLICDPSHIGGSRSMIYDISQKALDMGYDGLMIETHPDPDNALSDSKQQITPEQLKDIKHKLRIRQTTSDNVLFKTKLEELRNKIDSVDHDLIETLSIRMKLIEQIGEYKKENNVTIFQLERWNEIIKTRPQWAEALDLRKEFIEEIYKQIHSESLRNQTEILNKQKP